MARHPKDRHQVAYTLPQVEQYVEENIPMLLHNMSRMQNEERDAKAFKLEWHIIGKRPKVRNTWQFTKMMESCLQEGLSEAGMKIYLVWADQGTMTFTIRWVRS